MKGPYESNGLLKWVVYYGSQNKNHQDTNWKLCVPDDTITVYNGAVLIYTKITKESMNVDYPLILDTEDIDVSSASRLESIYEQRGK